MRDVLKTIAFIFTAGFFLFGSGFTCGYLFNRARSTGSQAGAFADVRNYDAAAGRIEYAAGTVENAARNIGEAAGEVRISVGEAGSIGDIAGGIGGGISRALDGAGSIAGGVQRIMAILDDAEKRNAEMETAGVNRMD
jgi:hypothetical protein